jgi:predicted SAM-dependent methyltransferase
MTKLHLCCGFDYKPGFVNIDNLSNGPQDITADLNKDWVFAKPNSVDYIFIKDGLEHLDSLEHFFKEAERILKTGESLKYGFRTLKVLQLIVSRINIIFLGVFLMFFRSLMILHKN